MAVNAGGASADGEGGLGSDGGADLESEGRLAIAVGEDVEGLELGSHSSLVSITGFFTSVIILGSI